MRPGRFFGRPRAPPFPWGWGGQRREKSAAGGKDNLPGAAGGRSARAALFPQPCPGVFLKPRNGARQIFQGGGSAPEKICRGRKMKISEGAEHDRADFFGGPSPGGGSAPGRICRGVRCPGENVALPLAARAAIPPRARVAPPQRPPSTTTLLQGCAPSTRAVHPPLGLCTLH